MKPSEAAQILSNEIAHLAEKSGTWVNAQRLERAVEAFKQLDPAPVYLTENGLNPGDVFMTPLAQFPTVQYVWQKDKGWGERHAIVYQPSGTILDWFKNKTSVVAWLNKHHAEPCGGNK